MDTQLHSGFAPRCLPICWRFSRSESWVARGRHAPAHGVKGSTKAHLVVVQVAKALTASNRRTIGRGHPKGRESPLVMGVSGELEGSSDLVMQRPNGALAQTDPDHLGPGLGKCQRLGMQRGRSAPCQDGVISSQHS